MMIDPNCPLCPRLAAHRDKLRESNPKWHNAPVPGVGNLNGWLAIIGLAPGGRGANRTGFPFTGDLSTEPFHQALTDAGLAQEDEESGLLLLPETRVTNAVRCLPPTARPDPEELRNCRPFLKEELQAMPNLKVVLALGQMAHQSAIKALGGKLPKHGFAHGAVHRLHTGYIVIDSHHPLRSNQNSALLTPDMFRQLLAIVCSLKP